MRIIELDLGVSIENGPIHGPLLDKLNCTYSIFEDLL